MANKLKSEIKCPNCGSFEVTKPRFSKKAMAISILLIGFPIPFLNKECHCFDCGTDFKYKKKTCANNGEHAGPR
jgi:uncharacterized Zn finger protein